MLFDLVESIKRIKNVVFKNGVELMLDRGNECS